MALVKDHEARSEHQESVTLHVESRAEDSARTPSTCDGTVDGIEEHDGASQRRKQRSTARRCLQDEPEREHEAERRHRVCEPIIRHTRKTLAVCDQVGAKRGRCNHGERQAVMQYDSEHEAR
jgi:hypothetical protein